MLISQSEHDHFQRGVTNQVATRLGIPEPQLYPESRLLELIAGLPDHNTYQATLRFKNTYREWYNRSVDLERAVAAGSLDVVSIRDQVRELRIQRDHHRKLLSGYLDEFYPSHTSASTRSS